MLRSIACRGETWETEKEERTKIEEYARLVYANDPAVVSRVARTIELDRRGVEYLQRILPDWQRLHREALSDRTEEDRWYWWKLATKFTEDLMINIITLLAESSCEFFALELSPLEVVFLGEMLDGQIDIELEELEEKVNQADAVIDFVLRIDAASKLHQQVLYSLLYHNVFQSALADCYARDLYHHVSP